MTDQIDFTALRGGYFRVWVNDAQISQHTTEREALEKASEEALNAPDASIKVDHDYHVEVSVNLPGNTPPPPIVVPPGNDVLINATPADMIYINALRAKVGTGGPVIRPPPIVRPPPETNDGNASVVKAKSSIGTPTSVHVIYDIT